MKPPHARQESSDDLAQMHFYLRSGWERVSERKTMIFIHNYAHKFMTPKGIARWEVGTIIVHHISGSESSINASDDKTRNCWRD